MKLTGSGVPMVLGACAVLAMTIGSAAQQPAPQAPQAAGGRGGGRGGVSPALFAAADTDKDGTLTRSEFKGTQPVPTGVLFDTAPAGETPAPA